MEEIHVITVSDNDGFVPALLPQFVVLGMLNEYMGRQIIEGGSTVERFFVDERPLANIFAKYLASYGQGLGADLGGISVVHANTGHAYVESTEMNTRVNALYRFEFEPDRFMTTPDGRKHRYANVALGIEDFPAKRSMLYTSATMDSRFSYLYGVLLRFGQDGMIVQMANASPKIELIERLLEEVGVEWVEHRYTVGGAPTCNRVAFGADHRLTTLLQAALSERAAAFADAGSAAR